jgi:hypothetical protein
MPAAVFAASPYEGLANCQWDLLKWETNPNSWHLYLQHWGRTPIQAMSRLSGLCGPDTLCAALGTNCPQGPNACWPCACSSCRDTEQGCLAGCDDLANCVPAECTSACPVLNEGECGVCTGGCNPSRVFPGEKPHCAGCWGVSLAFASKSWAAATISTTDPRLNDEHPNHRGVSPTLDDPTACASNGNSGGDWGLSGCPHTECCTLSWCLQDNCFTSGNCH